MAENKASIIIGVHNDADYSRSATYMVNNGRLHFTIGNRIALVESPSESGALRRLGEALIAASDEQDVREATQAGIWPLGTYDPTPDPELERILREEEEIERRVRGDS